MNIQEYNWKNRYISGQDNILEDFFIPALERSKHYYRIAGYFKSTVLAAAARGIASFIENGEKMYLVIGAEISKEDANAINRGEENSEKVLENNLKGELKDVEKSIVEKRLEALAYLVASGKLEIKIGFNTDEDGTVLPSSESLWHEKVILFEDEEGNKIHIDGSVNETISGWTRNRESFSVHRSWKENQKGYIESAEEEFEKVWNGRDQNSRLFSVPKAIEKELLEYKPSSPPRSDPMEQKEEIELWPPQRRAIENWIDNDYRGIFEMATGTGKTLASLFAADKRFRPEDTLVILVPFKPLIGQWEEEIKTPQRKFEDVDIIKCSSDYRWKDDLADFLLRNKSKNRDIVIATMDTAITERFQNILKEYVDPENLILIVDEVHNIGSPERRKFLYSVSADRGRIGLSATPERLWDTEGTEAIMDYFDGKVIEYGIKEAIDSEIDGQRFLAPYDYHIHFVSLTDEERREYNQITSQIARLYSKLDEDERKELIQSGKSSTDEKLERLLIQRANILKQADRKVEKAREIIRENDNLDRCLVYCSDTDQLESLKNRLLEDSENVCKYTSELQRSQQKNALENFRTGVADVMVAIKCLDEGVDIPVCDSAIVLSSSRNPREFVQRRGRVLRKSEDKDRAIIHDLVVLPYEIEKLKNKECDISEGEYRILERELERVEIFRKSAENSAEVLMDVQDIKSLLKDNKK